MIKKIKFKYSKKIISNTLTYKIAMAINLSITVFSILLVVLYVIGNYQDFQDITQHYILGILSFVSIFNAIFSILLFFESIIKLIHENRKIKTLINSFFLILTVIFEFFCIELSIIISYLSNGF